MMTSSYRITITFVLVCLALILCCLGAGSGPAAENKNQDIKQLPPKTVNRFNRQTGDQPAGDCSDVQPSRLAAILLAAFMGPTGAANFYIGQDVLGLIQLSMLLILTVSCFIVCCYPCCICCCGTDRSKDEGSWKPCCGCLMALFGISALLLGLATVAWWIADIVIFVTNGRLTGDGCNLELPKGVSISE